MMKNRSHTLEDARLLAHRSLDEALSAEEQATLDKLLVQYPDVQQELSSL